MGRLYDPGVFGAPPVNCQSTAATCLIPHVQLAIASPLRFVTSPNACLGDFPVGFFTASQARTAAANFGA